MNTRLGFAKRDANLPIKPTLEECKEKIEDLDERYSCIKYKKDLHEAQKEASLARPGEQIYLIPRDEHQSTRSPEG